MTIQLSLAHTDNLDVLSHDVFLALRETRPDLAREAAAVRSQARDAAEYIGAVLALSDELQVVWKEVG